MLVDEVGIGDVMGSTLVGSSGDPDFGGDSAEAVDGVLEVGFAAGEFEEGFVAAHAAGVAAGEEEAGGGEELGICHLRFVMRHLSFVICCVDGI